MNKPAFREMNVNMKINSPTVREMNANMKMISPTVREMNANMKMNSPTVREMNANMDVTSTRDDSRRSYPTPDNSIPSIQRISGRSRPLSGSAVVMLFWLTVGSMILWIQHVEAISLAPVGWNSSNPMFKTSKNDHLIEVKLYDDIDFICPYYPSGSAHSEPHHLEHYIIYMVSKSEYDDCNIYSETSVLMVLNCSNPRQRKRFTILFEPFQSIPNVPEYHPEGSYYFMTTSTGRLDGLNNLYQGACHRHNMKLTVRVCCSPPSTVRTAKARLSHTAPPPRVLVNRQPGDRYKLEAGEKFKDRNRVFIETLSAVPSTATAVQTSLAQFHIHKHAADSGDLNTNEKHRAKSENDAAMMSPAKLEGIYSAGFTLDYSMSVVLNSVILAFILCHR